MADFKLGIARKRRVNDNSAYPNVMLAYGEEGSEFDEELPVPLVYALPTSLEILTGRRFQPSQG